MENSIYQLQEKVFKTIRMNNNNFRRAFELTKTGDLAQIDEQALSTFKSNLQLRQHILGTIKFFGENYNDGSVDDTFVFNLITQLVAEDTRNNNVSAECVYILVNTIFPKISSMWDDKLKRKLIEIIKTLQEHILSSNDYSIRVKQMLTELLVFMNLRFKTDVQLKLEKIPDEIFTLADLQQCSISCLRETFPEL